MDPLRVAYVLAFGLAGAACFGAIPRARQVETPDTRRGLVALLATSGGWAVAHVGVFALPGYRPKVVAYVAGLVVGLSTVGAWLYFCSAYTGRTLHRESAYRWTALAAFLLVVAVKVTNPVHGLYFSASVGTTPFPHLVVQNSLVHWVVTGLAYALAAVGYFMLFELFSQTKQDARPLAALVAVTGLPLALNLVGYASPYLVDITYEPIGVAVFAVGVLYVYTERFETIRLASNVEDPLVVLSADDRVRDYNEQAARLFSGLTDSVGRPLSEAVPRLADCPDDENVIDVELDGERRHYLVSSAPLTLGQRDAGRILTLTDVTRSERYRQELERQNDRLERFAGVVSHDLRNPLSVAKARLEIARSERDSEHLEAAAGALDRMEALVDDVLTLAREGQSIGETAAVDLASVATRAWGSVDAPDAGFVTGDTTTLEADADRLQQLLENLFRNAVEHGSTSPDSQARQDAVEHGSTGSQTQSDDAVEHSVSDEPPVADAPEDAVEHGSTNPDSQARQDAVEHGSTSNQPSADDAVDHGGPTVTVRVGALDDGRGFYVEDDGPGIPESEREAVFEAGHTTAEGGTGFGLAIVTEIVDAHDWRIEVTESDDGGARFEIRTE